MTDEPDDLTGPEGSEPPVEDSLDAWAEKTAEPTWIPIDPDVQPAAVAEPIQGSGPAPQDEPTPASDVGVDKAGVDKAGVDEPTPTAPAAAPTPSSAPASPGGRPRRPSSLRAALDERVPNVPRRPIEPPPFDGDTPPVSGPAAAAGPQSAARPGPVDAAKQLASSLPKRMVALTNERPEVGLGVAFLGGLVLATILKRLGRK